VSKEVGPAAAGWYPVASHDGPLIDYWDGTAWTGVPQPPGAGGTQPKDSAGVLALVLLVAGFLGTIGVPMLLSALRVPTSLLTSAMLADLALTPIALVLSIGGLVRGFTQKFKTPMSLAVVIVSALGTIFLAVPIGLFVAGVWVLPHF
jgi:hypothetical protein